MVENQNIQLPSSKWDDGSMKLEPIKLNSAYHKPDAKVVALEHRLKLLDNLWNEALITKNNISVGIGTGLYPNADFVYLWMQGIDNVINSIISERTILRWNHGDIDGDPPQGRNRVYPDPELRRKCIEERNMRDEMKQRNSIPQFPAI